MSWLLPPLPPKFSAALRDVNAQRVEARIAAATRLGKPADGEERERAFEALQRSLDDRDARVRAAAVQSYAELAEVRAVPLLRGRLTDSDAMVREIATLALSDFGWEAASEALLSALRSEHPEVRFQALAAAAKSGDDRVGDHVLRALADDDPFVRASAVQAAGLLEDVARPEALVRKLRAALEDSEHPVRCQAAIALAGFGESVAADALLIALDDPAYRMDALEVAPELRDARIRERVAFLGGSVLGSRLVAAAAGRASARMGDPRGIGVLRDVLRAWRTQGRTFAVQTVGELGLVPLAPELVRLSERPRAVDPGTLAESLAAVGEKEALRRMGERQDEFGGAAREVLARGERA